MSQHQLDSALKCSECGTVRMNIPPDDFDDKAEVTCSTCGRPMGSWGEIKADFARQAGNGVFLLVDGQFKT